MTSVSDLSYLSNRSNINCICGDQGGFIVRRKDRYGIRFLYKLCLKCGHVRTSNPLSSESAHHFYSSSDYRSMYLPGKDPKTVLLGKTPKPNTLSPLLKLVQSLSIPRGNLVEWGCGGGWNLVPFRDAGWRVQGFDYDKRYVELGKSLLGLDLHEIPSEKIVLRTIRPDVIVLNHVLEHATDPMSLLKRLRTMCTEQTVLIVGVPLLETISVWHWRSFFHVAHIHYFSADSMARTARESGFRIIHSDIKSGEFVLTKTEMGELLPIRRRAVLQSVVALLKGFLEPSYQLRHVAHRIKKRVIG